MSEADRRLQPRHAAGLDIRIGFAPGRVLEIGFGGALVETHEWLSLGQRSNFRLVQPPLQISAFVVRCRLVRVDGADGRPVYEVGLRFDDSPAIRQQLADVVAPLRRRADAAVVACS